MLDLLRPAEVRDVYQTVDAFFELNEQAKVREVANDAFLLGVDRVTLVDLGPRVLLQLLQAEGHLAVFAVDVEDNAFDFVADTQEILCAAEVL